MKNLAAETKNLLEEIETLRTSLFKTDVFSLGEAETIAAE